MRSLFVRDFRRTFLTSLAVFIVCWALTEVAARFARGTASADDVYAIGDAFLLILLLPLIAGGVGIWTSSESFKQRYSAFLFSLPVSRYRIWLTAAAARGLGPWPAYALLVGVKYEPFLQHVAPLDVALPGLVLAYFSVFALGAFVGAAFRSATASYLCGVVVWLALYLQVCFVLCYLFFPAIRWHQAGGDPFRIVRDLPAETLGSPLRLGLGLALVMTVIFLAGAALLYRFGETELKRRADINKAICSAVVLCMMFSLWIVAEIGFLGKSDIPGGWEDPRTTKDGRYALIAEEHDATSKSGSALAVVVDLQTGEEVWANRVQGLLDFAWSEDDEAIRLLLRDDSPLRRLGYLLPERPHRIKTIRLDGKGLRIVEAGETTSFSEAAVGDVEEISPRASTGRLVVRRGSDGRQIFYSDGTFSQRTAEGEERILWSARDRK